MALDGSESIVDLLEALAMAGLGTVECKAGDMDLVSRDQEARNPALHLLPIGVGEARHDGRCTADSVLPRG